MKQLTAQVLEPSAGFHTPRSAGGLNSGFDENGYPLSPGGTVIRPPPLPPPVGPTTPGMSGAGQEISGSGLGLAEGLLPE